MIRYFVITNSDGDVSIDQMDRETLLQRLNEEYYGDNDDHVFSLPDNYDLTANDKPIIIKGEIVTPRAQKHVTKWEVT